MNEIGELRKRERILEAAWQLFAERGYDAVSTREIAETAQVNSALIYYYFQDKAGLYRHVLDDVFGSISKRIQELANREGSPEVLLGELAHEYVNFLQERRGVMQLMYYELARGGTQLSDLTHTYFRDGFSVISDLIERGIKEDSLRLADPLLSAVSLISMLSFYFVAHPVLSDILGAGAYSREGIKAYLDHTLSLYFKGLLKDDYE